MKFEMTWRNKFLTVDAKSIEDMAGALRKAAQQLEAMAQDGVTLAEGQDDDYARLITTNPEVAKKYGMETSHPIYDHGGEG